MGIISSLGLLPFLIITNWKRQSCGGWEDGGRRARSHEGFRRRAAKARTEQLQTSPRNMARVDLLATTCPVVHQFGAAGRAMGWFDVLAGGGFAVDVVQDVFDA